MGKRVVFRPPKDLLYVGGLLVAVPALIGLAIMGGTSIAATIVFCGLIFLGQLIWLSAWNTRIEVSDEGVSTFNLWRRPIFQARWEEITGFQRGPDERILFNLSNSRWTLLTKDRHSRLIQVDNPAALLSAIVSRLPGGALQARQVPRPRSALDVYQSKMRGGATRKLLPASVMMYGFLICFTVAFFLSNGPIVASAAVLAFAALLGISTFRRFRTAWRRFLRGGVLADRDGVTVNDGAKTTYLAWKDVRIVERTTLDIINDRSTQRITLVTDEAAVVVDDDVFDFETLVEVVYQHLPPTASVFL